MSESAPLADTLGRWQRGVVAGVGVILVAHSAIVALWLAPSSPIRQAVGDSRLSTYVDPYFQQGDQIVGGSSNRVDEALFLRAFVRPVGGGDPIFTDWIDVTSREMQAVGGGFDPPRARQISRRVAANLNFALFSLTDEQRELVAKTKAKEPAVTLQQRLLAADGARARDVQNWIAQDRMATQYASLWLGAEFADVEVLQVQYRVGRRVVPAYSDRATSKIDGQEFSTFTTGWRPAFRADAEARAAFTDYFARSSND